MRAFIVCHLIWFLKVKKINTEVIAILGVWLLFYRILSAMSRVLRDLFLTQVNIRVDFIDFIFDFD